MLDQAIRFGAIFAQPEFRAGGKTLEVGSGSRGLAAFTKDPVIGVDIAFENRPCANLSAIRASATNLPLFDATFDRVVCSDMLEHLHPSQRKDAIRELLRVTRGTLFLACPCDEGARQVEDRLSKLYQMLGVSAPDWLQDHLRKVIPDSDAIRQTLDEHKASWREITGESTTAHFFVSLLISIKIINRLWEFIFRGRANAAKRLGSARILVGRRHYRKLWVVKPTKPAIENGSNRGTF